MLRSGDAADIDTQQPGQEAVAGLGRTLAGVGVAYAAMPAQVHVKTLTEGHGPSPTTEDMVLINYKGTLPDGKVFDEAKQVPMELTGVIPGFSTALQKASSIFRLAI